MVKKPKQAKTKKTVKAAPVTESALDAIRRFAQPDVRKPECCGNCRFWVDTFCKRYPPDKREGQANATHRSVMLATEWCGEHQRTQSQLNG